MHRFYAAAETHSGNCVTSSTGVTATPASASAFCVPPVERISHLHFVSLLQNRRGRFYRRRREARGHDRGWWMVDREWWDRELSLFYRFIGCNAIVAHLVLFCYNLLEHSHHVRSHISQGRRGQKGAKHVLIIEDEHALSHALELKFTHEGFVCTVANNGAEGLKEANTGKICSHPPRSHHARDGRLYVSGAA